MDVQQEQGSSWDGRGQWFWESHPGGCVLHAPGASRASLARAPSGAGLPEVRPPRKAGPRGKWPAALGASKSGDGRPESLLNVSLVPDIPLQNKIWLPAGPPPPDKVSPSNPDAFGPTPPPLGPTGAHLRRPKERAEPGQQRVSHATPGWVIKQFPPSPQPMSPTFSSDSCPFHATDPLARTYI